MAFLILPPLPLHPSYCSEVLAFQRLLPPFAACCSRLSLPLWPPRTVAAESPCRGAGVPPRKPFRVNVSPCYSRAFLLKSLPLHRLFHSIHSDIPQQRFSLIISVEHGVPPDRDSHVHVYKKVIIFDCRYDYEYKGGHIQSQPPWVTVRRVRLLMAEVTITPILFSSSCSRSRKCSHL